jgi:16S rRNA (guanine1516-N2)-methyltransferase
VVIKTNTTNYINYLTVDIKQDVAIFHQSDLAEDRALCERLAETHDIPWSSPDLGETTFCLSYRNNRLELYSRTTAGLQGPLGVDFLSARNIYRFKHDLRIDQPLARAAGIKQGRRPTVCDGTAGLGRDGFILAALGCSVWLLERSFPVWLILEDGIRRAGNHPDIGGVFRDRITLVHDDTATFLASSTHVFETVYLDPMYPHRTKSSLNKKELRQLKAVVGPDPDSAELLRAVRTRAVNRTVVKRPALAPPLAPDPDFSIRGKSTRYDIYLTPT